MNWEPFILSIKLAGTTTLVLYVIGLPLAAWLSSSRSRWKFIVESAVALPIVLPPTVLGYYVLVAISPTSWLGSVYLDLFGTSLPFSFTGLVFASVLYSLPFAVQPFLASFDMVDPKLKEAAWTLGASRFKAFWTITMPLSLSGVITGGVLSFAHTLGEFGVVLLVGGNIPGATRVVSISIYDHVQALEYDKAGQSSLILLLFSFFTLAGVYALNRKVWAVSPKSF